MKTYIIVVEQRDKLAHRDPKMKSLIEYFENELEKSFEDSKESRSNNPDNSQTSDKPQTSEYLSKQKSGINEPMVNRFDHKAYESVDENKGNKSKIDQKIFENKQKNEEAKNVEEKKINNGVAEPVGLELLLPNSVVNFYKRKRYEYLVEKMENARKEQEKKKKF
eukprot:TRINITY_DN10355_c0_g1_i1.p1 TRINITY_DN10355_c0_g1~~TRINITY_DN10355_c0_g1_i1.p1  ORF type:complete len:181 (-),score=51.82 TRINITY_DN10355_c0_g1_i1:67-561(-)